MTFSILVGADDPPPQPVWAPGVVLTSPFWWFFLSLRWLPHTHGLFRSQRPEGALCSSLELSLWEVLISRTLQGGPHPLWPPWLPLHLLDSRGLPGSESPSLRSAFVGLLSLVSPLSAIAVMWCLMSYVWKPFCILFSPRFLVVSDRRVNPFPVTPSLSEEIHEKTYNHTKTCMYMFVGILFCHCHQQEAVQMSFTWWMDEQTITSIQWNILQ